MNVIDNGSSEPRFLGTKAASTSSPPAFAPRSPSSTVAPGIALPGPVLARGAPSASAGQPEPGLATSPRTQSR